MVATVEKKKLSILNVQTIEQEIALIRESEEDYSKNWGMPAKEAYIKGLEFINNLKL